MIDLVLELAAGSGAATAAARLALKRRYRHAVVDVGKELDDLERWHEIEWTARLAGYDADLCIAAADQGRFMEATCARSPARSRRDLEHELFFGPGAVWPVDSANHVQVMRGAFSATSWTASQAHPLLVEQARSQHQLAAMLAARGLVGSAAQLSLDDELRR